MSKALDTELAELSADIETVRRLAQATPEPVSALARHLMWIYERVTKPDPSEIAEIRKRLAALEERTDHHA